VNSLLCQRVWGINIPWLLIIADKSQCSNLYLIPASHGITLKSLDFTELPSRIQFPSMATDLKTLMKMAFANAQW
jgi:hypothetical protein